MINYRQKEFAEYDAMRSLYVELMRPENRLRVEIISPSELIPVLKGNNVVIEKFVISTSLFNKDKYRLYLKVGARAKMPDSVYLGSRNEYRKLGLGSLTLKGSHPFRDPTTQKTFGDGDDKKKKKKKGGGNDSKPGLSGNIPINVEFGYSTTIPSAETIEYDLKSRSLVLEVNSIRDAINVLNVLPFGINYRLYLVS